MLEVGSIVGGKFRIERILGQGGMGMVAVATHLQLDQLVALKVLLDPVLDDPEAIQRFMREARASARLRSEHVCRVSDVGQLDDGAPYLVMELLEGADLAAWAADGPMAIAQACDYVLQACVAIAEAHALGIVHRDLKPANLFLTRRLDHSPLVKVLDFGIAKAQAAGEFKITKTSTVMGSPGYMSPEQLRSAKDADPRSDIWALGVILYELVTGRLPFQADTITELAVKVVMDPPDPLGIDAPEFAAVVMKCLAKDPDQRYADVTALAADLAALVGEPAKKTAQLVATLNHALPRSAAVSVQRVVSPSAATQPSGVLAAQSVAGVATAATASHAMPMPAQARAPSAVGTMNRAIGTAPTMAPSDSVVAPPVTPPATSTRRRPWLLGALVIAVAAAAAGGAVVATRGSHDKPHHAKHEGSAQVVAQAMPADAGADAAAAIDAAPVDPNAEVRANLRELATKQDWPAVLAFEDMAKADPEIAAITDDARAKYLAQQGHAIDAQVKAGGCGRAKQLAEAAHEVVPDDTTLAAKAKACKPRPVAPAPTPAPAPPPPRDEEDERRSSDPLEAARDAQRAGHWQAALTSAQETLKRQPNNVVAQMIALTAACQLGQAQIARDLFDRAPRMRVQRIRQTCARHGVEL